MKYKVIGWRVLVKPDDFDELLQEQVPEDLKKAGFTIALPEAQRRQAEKATSVGTVVDVGDWAFKAYFKSTNGEAFECPIKVNDRVTYARYSANIWEDPDTEEKYAILNDEDIQLIQRV